MKGLVTTIVAATGLLVVPNASAEVFTTCEQAEEFCECPSSEPFVCSEIDGGELMMPDDAEGLRDVAGIESMYDSESGVWYVHVTMANEFNGGTGVLPMHSNQGSWDSWEELRTYVSDLTGVPYEYLEGGNYLFGNVNIIQNFPTVKYDQFQQSWAQHMYRNLLYDAISDGSGRVLVDGEPFDLVIKGSETLQCKSPSDGNFSVKQCSDMELGTEPRPTPDPEEPVVDVSVSDATSKIYDFRVDGEQTHWLFTPGCTGGDLPCVKFWTQKVLAEQASLEGDYWDNGTRKLDGLYTQETDTIGITHHVRRVGSERHTGVCDVGAADRGNDSVEAFTQDGGGVSICP